MANQTESVTKAAPRSCSSAAGSASALASNALAAAGRPCGIHGGSCTAVLIYGDGYTNTVPVASRVSQAVGASDRSGQRPAGMGRTSGRPTLVQNISTTCSRRGTQNWPYWSFLPPTLSKAAKTTAVRLNLHCLEQQLRVRVPRVKSVFVGVCHQPPQRIQRGGCVEVIGQRYEHGTLRCCSLCGTATQRHYTTNILATCNDAACNVSQTASSPACNIPYNM